MSERAEVLVRGLIEDGEGRILLVRHTSRDWWFFPGGHLERGESIAACLQRELREEGEIDVHPTALSAIVENRYSEDGEDRVEVNIVLHARATGTIGAVEDKLEFRWVPASEMAGVAILPESVKHIALLGQQAAVSVNIEGLGFDSNEKAPELP